MEKSRADLGVVVFTKAHRPGSEDGGGISGTPSRQRRKKAEDLQRPVSGWRAQQGADSRSRRHALARAAKLTPTREPRNDFFGEIAVVKRTAAAIVQEQKGMTFAMTPTIRCLPLRARQMANAQPASPHLGAGRQGSAGVVEISMRGEGSVVRVSE